jgi:hypothetical protein
VDAPHCLGLIATAPQLLLNLLHEPLLAVALDLGEALPVHPRGSLVGLHALPGFLHDVESTDLVVEKREPPFRLPLGRPVERSLQFADLVHPLGSGFRPG